MHLKVVAAFRSGQNRAWRALITRPHRAGLTDLRGGAAPESPSMPPPQQPERLPDPLTSLFFKRPEKPRTM